MLQVPTVFLFLIVTLLFQPAFAARLEIPELSSCSDYGDQTAANNMRASLLESYQKFSKSHQRFRSDCDTIPSIPDQSDPGELNKAEEIEKLKVKALTVNGDLGELKQEYLAFVDARNAIRKAIPPTNGVPNQCLAEIQGQGGAVIEIGKSIEVEPKCDAIPLQGPGAPQSPPAGPATR